MTIRLPSSLKWLIDKRARLDAELKRTEQSARRAKALLKELSALQRLLKSVDETLRLHEISVDVQNTQPIRSAYKRLSTPRGLLTSTIINALKASADGTLTTWEIVAAVMKQIPSLDNGNVDQYQLKQSIRYRLKRLRQRGVVTAHHRKGYAPVGIWSLKN